MTEISYEIFVRILWIVREGFNKFIHHIVSLWNKFWILRYCNGRLYILWFNRTRIFTQLSARDVATYHMSHLALRPCLVVDSVNLILLTGPKIVKYIPTLQPIYKQKIAFRALVLTPDMISIFKITIEYIIECIRRKKELKTTI